MPPPVIRVLGARQNNLKGFDLDLPLGELAVVTGLSGSGKSSLAFDTLYAEGQRRYIESFSAYARQFLDRMDRPAVDRIEGIPPAIAIDQTDPVRSSRSTVGTMTEINDYMKLLFARAGQLHCSGCGQLVASDTAESVAARLSELPSGSRVLIAFSRLSPRGWSWKRIARELAPLGFRRVLIEGRPVEIEQVAASGSPGPTFEVVVDRLVWSPKERQRAIDSLEQALLYGSGKGALHVTDPRGKTSSLPFSSGRHCAACDIQYREPLPSIFSFNNPLGACEACKGFGRAIEIDMRKVIPDPGKSLSQGAIKPWTTRAYAQEARDLERACARLGIPMDRPFALFDAAQRRLVIEGDGTKRGWYGVRGFFDWLETRTYRMHIRVLLSRYRGYVLCQSCGGARLKAEGLLYRVGGMNIAQAYALPVAEASRFFESLELSPLERGATGMVLAEIRARLSYLVAVGLGYLTLDRQSRTLSGGEVQRVNLTTALGSALVNTLYVLDEPSIGLHPRDNHRLIRILKGIRDLGNTVMVVEHEPAVMREADRILEMGPGSGAAGGQIVFNGSYREALSAKESLTGRYLSGAEAIPVPRRRPPDRSRLLKLEGASCHNIKDLDLEIPLGRLVCVTGVSGSGKSTLAGPILHQAMMAGLRGASGRWRAQWPDGADMSGMSGEGDEEHGVVMRLEGADRISECVMVDQSPIGRTPRSNPVTYMKAFDSIRSLFASVPAARARGLAPGSFSFNAPGGRCEACKGEGFHRIEMQFLSDVFVTCTECGGLRYKKDLLEVLYRGKSIADALAMTVQEALEFFGDQPRVTGRLSPMVEVGLGYLRLGQPVNTLSGGESQRLKLARQLSAGGGGGVMFLFDEPTTGLHFQDVRILLGALDRLVETGSSVIVIEHNLEVIKCADWVIDLGPEAGEAGGRVVAAGTPEQVAQAGARGESLTGRYLAAALMPGQPVEPAAALSPAIRSAGDAKADGSIRIQGAREHNLQGIDAALPREKLVVVTGLSGSGKSTLAFDVLFAEGQRRYIDSLSAYARQYIRQLHRPDVDFVSGVPPTVSIEQRASHGGRKSTVATVTEVYHYLRLLYAKTGRQHCHRCGLGVSAWTLPEMVDEIVEQAAGRLARVLAPVVVNRKGMHREVLEGLRKGGFLMARLDGRFRKLEEATDLDRFREHSIEVLVGLMEVAPRRRKAVESLVKRALEVGRGGFYLVPHGGGSRKERYYSLERSCPRCRVSYPELDPHHFSFNSRHGSCPECSGYGRDDHGRACSSCGGARIRPEGRAVQVASVGIHEVAALPAAEALRWVRSLKLKGRSQAIAADILREIAPRLEFLGKVGLDYLTLDRSVTSLSGGEAQRIRLAAQLGSNLRGACYVLDEPTIGLHPSDSRRLIETLRELRDRGNTIVVVEHDEETIRAADWILDLGPGAGRDGGRIVAQGSLQEIISSPDSLTGRCLASRTRPQAAAAPRATRPARRWLEVIGAAEHNLAGMDVAFPVGALTCVTGVSGSGKSTLVRDVLYAGMRRLLYEEAGTPGRCRGIRGSSAFSRVVEVDQTPIGKTPRSVPASYAGFFDDIRRVFAMVPEARARGYSSSRFSFNVTGGRCERCAGQGRVRVEMSFLPDVWIECGECMGRRYNAETLEIRFKGKSMAEVLDLTASEAVSFFEKIPGVCRFVTLMEELGLGYLTLGQPSPTLSGGEAQRVKLVSELGKPSRASTLFILDEPTTGLHMADVSRLMRALHMLVHRGHTVILIEHNLDVIAGADYIVDLGPGGGERGGRLVAAGTPGEVACVPASRTGEYLKRALALQGLARRPDVTGRAAQ